MASIILKWKRFGITKTFPGVGHPAKLSNRGRMSLVSEVIKNPVVTLTELQSSSVEMGEPSRRRTISTEELCQSDHQVPGHLPDQGPTPLLAQFGQASSSTKSLGGSKRLPFKNDGGHCVLGDLKCCRHCLVSFPRSVPRHKPVSKLYGQFLRPHGLVFALTCTVNCGILYIDRCVCFQIMRNHLNLQRWTSIML